MKAIVLAGGKGTRLSPYTKILPKPLVPIGEMPILEILLRQMKKAGIEEVILAVGYLAELIQAFFQDGKRFGLSIEYSFEIEPLGTAGPLALLEKRIDATFLVVNGDVLTTLDIRKLVEAHRRSGAIATIAAHRRKVKIDLGVMQLNVNDVLEDYIEKPAFDYIVSMGIYVFERRVLDYIPSNQYLDFPDLIHKLLQSGECVKGYLFDGYWQDLGRTEDYEQAVQNFEDLRPLILGKLEG